MLERIKIMAENKIKVKTRQNISDEMRVAELRCNGSQPISDFLAHTFNLQNLPSSDRRFTNAYDDIHQHMVNNNDWDTDWFYSDSRINLLHCSDATYLDFLSRTLHPIVRMDSEEVARLLEIYNKYLSRDGFEILHTSDISGKPVYSGRQRIIGISHLNAKKVAIKKYLDTAYVNNKINTMNEAIYKDTDLAIGTAKELLETTCKSILQQRGETIKSEWTLSQLLNATKDILDIKPKDVSDPEKGERSIKQILGGISSIVQGVTELRNNYGTGHGKSPEFKGLETKYAKLIVGVVSEVAILFLSINGETAELVETEPI